MTARTTEVEEYMSQLKSNMTDMSDEEKISLLLDDIAYWYFSAITWRNRHTRLSLRVEGHSERMTEGKAE